MIYNITTLLQNNSSVL